MPSPPIADSRPSASPASRTLPGVATAASLISSVSPAGFEPRLDAFFGRLAELSGGLTTQGLSFAFRLIHEAQRRGEPAAWVSGDRGCFFPPDAEDGGIDLAALIVVRLPSIHLAPRAAELLLRSGGFGLVVLDLGAERTLPLAVQTRLASLAQKQAAAVLCLTEKPAEASSLGSLVSLRLESARTGCEGDRLIGIWSVLKDKHGCSRGEHREVFRAPDGLC